MADQRSVESYDLMVQMLSHVFRSTTSLKSSRLGYINCSEAFFKKWSKLAPPTNLTTLHLTDVKTRYKYWAIYIRSCGKNLKTFEMDRVAFTRPDEQWAIFDFLASLSLSRCVLRKIAVGDKILLFDDFYETLPATRVKYKEAPNGGPDGGELVEVPRTKYPDDELHLYNTWGGDDEVDDGLVRLSEVALTDW